MGVAVITSNVKSSARQPQRAILTHWKLSWHSTSGGRATWTIDELVVHAFHETTKIIVKNKQVGVFRRNPRGSVA
jgi:hypothetical protein